MNKFPTQTTDEVVADVKAEEVEDVKAEESVSDVPAKTAESVVDVRAEDAPSQERIDEVKFEEVNEVETQSDEITIVQNAETHEKVSDQNAILVKNEPEESLVFGVVSFDNSPNSSLLQADLKSLEGLIFRQNHMKENIRKLEYGKYYSSKSRTQRFKHTLEIKLVFKTKKLWENARSYIWRHFGQQEWESKNGTKLTINRIHMKNL